MDKDLKLIIRAILDGYDDKTKKKAIEAVMNLYVKANKELIR